MTIKIRPATPTDIDSIMTLMPRLAEFELPENRKPEYFWQEDAKVLQEWATGEKSNVFVLVGVDEREKILGVTIVSMGDEFFSHEPSAHLEVVTVAKEADGSGLGRRLIVASEAEAKKRGALSMSLHVVKNNHRARHVYEKIGYTEELIRAIKFL
ncbi:MAG: GNAT family N-acetyltransferase [Chloroflexota bacterium]